MAPPQNGPNGKGGRQSGTVKTGGKGKPTGTHRPTGKGK